MSKVKRSCESSDWGRADIGSRIGPVAFASDDGVRRKDMAEILDTKFGESGHYEQSPQKCAPSNAAVMMNTESATAIKGIWGLNTIPMLFLLLWALSYTCNLVAALPLSQDNLSISTMLIIATNLVGWMFCVYALVLAARRSSSYPQLTTVLFWSIPIIRLVIIELELDISFYHVARFLIEICFALFWTLHFKYADKIKNTFVNAPANWRVICRILICILAFVIFFLFLLKVVR